ncbi:MAG TPA: zinc-ribbon domain-containing protein [Verrucomicrobiae bacterium]|nr:zinc-ribbon domain-containing protein [Verrucomicrobiae bacterium]
MKPSAVCPNCGAEVPPNARACPECGSDETTGWSETAYTSSLGLPDEEFDYDEFVKEEFGAGRAKPHGLSWVWWVTGLLLAVLLLILFL